MPTKLMLTMQNNGIPSQILDDIEKALHSYYEKQNDPAYRTWGRCWEIQIITDEDPLSKDDAPKSKADDPLLGAIIELPGGEQAMVLSIQDRYDDGVTLRYVTGKYAGSLTERDTYAVRRYPVVRNA